MKNFLEPTEKSLNMIRQYSQILLDSAYFEVAVQSRFAYTILIAHVNSYIFEHANKEENKLEFEFKKLLVGKFLSLGNEVRITKIFFNGFSIKKMVKIKNRIEI